MKVSQHFLLQLLDEDRVRSGGKGAVGLTVNTPNLGVNSDAVSDARNHQTEQQSSTCEEHEDNPENSFIDQKSSIVVTLHGDEDQR